MEKNVSFAVLAIPKLQEIILVQGCKAVNTEVEQKKVNR